MHNSQSSYKLIYLIYFSFWLYWFKNLRFRKFVEPGDQCIFEVEKTSGDTKAHDQIIETSCRIFANGQRVFQADIAFKTMFSSAYVDRAGFPIGYDSSAIPQTKSSGVALS